MNFRNTHAHLKIPYSTKIALWFVG